MCKDLTTTVYKSIQPEGPALTLVVVAIIFTVFSSFVVLLRFYVRVSLGPFSACGLVCVTSQIVNVGHKTAVIVLLDSSIGSRDGAITVGMVFHMGLWTIIWQFLYVMDGALIKASIIWTLFRLAKGLNKVHTRILWALFALRGIVWQISWPVAIFQCKPVSAAWEKPGDCTSGQKVILNVSYFVSATNVFTDFSTSIVLNVQLPKKLKITTMGILSLGVLASVAAIARISYTWAYTATNERYYTIVKIIMLTVLECHLGIISGSMLMLRRLLRIIALSLVNTDVTPGRSRDLNILTIGGGTSGRRTHIKLSNAAGNTRNDERDDSQDKENTDGETGSRSHIIHATRQVEQDCVSGRGILGNIYEVVVSGNNGVGAGRPYGGARSVAERPTTMKGFYIP